jgi:hypothetical protein
MAKAICFLAIIFFSTYSLAHKGKYDLPAPTTQCPSKGKYDYNTKTTTQCTTCHCPSGFVYDGHSCSKNSTVPSLIKCNRGVYSPPDCCIETVAATLNCPAGFDNICLNGNYNSKECCLKIDTSDKISKCPKNSYRSHSGECIKNVTTPVQYKCPPGYSSDLSSAKCYMIEYADRVPMCEDGIITPEGQCMTQVSDYDYNYCCPAGYTCPGTQMTQGCPQCVAYETVEKQCGKSSKHQQTDYRNLKKSSKSVMPFPVNPCSCPKGYTDPCSHVTHSGSSSHSHSHSNSNSHSNKGSNSNMYSNSYSKKRRLMGNCNQCIKEVVIDAEKSCKHFTGKDGSCYNNVFLQPSYVCPAGYYTLCDDKSKDKHCKCAKKIYCDAIPQCDGHIEGDICYGEIVVPPIYVCPDGYTNSCPQSSSQSKGKKGHHGGKSGGFCGCVRNEYAPGQYCCPADFEQVSERVCNRVSTPIIKCPMGSYQLGDICIVTSVVPPICNTPAPSKHSKGSNQQSSYQSHKGGYQPQPSKGGYQPQPSKGGYQPQPSKGGYQPQPSNGGYQSHSHGKK